MLYFLFDVKHTNAYLRSSLFGELSILSHSVESEVFLLTNICLVSDSNSSILISGTISSVIDSKSKDPYDIFGFGLNVALIESPHDVIGPLRHLKQLRLFVFLLVLAILGYIFIVGIG